MQSEHTYLPPRRSYSTRVFTLAAAFVWVATIVIVIVFYYRETVFKAESVNADLQSQSAAILDALDRGVPAPLVADSVRKVNKEMRLTVLDTLGHVIYDTGGIPAGTDHSDRREVKMAMAGAEGYTMSRSSTASGGGNYFYSARADGGNYIVRASLPYGPGLTGRLQGETSYVVVALLMSLVLTVIAFAASRRMGRDVEQMLHENSEKLKAEEKERTMMKTRLTSNINHELKNPVHALSACIETLDEHLENLSPQQAKQLCDTARQEVNRIEALIADIGTLTRLSEADEMPLEKQQFDIKAILDDISSHVAQLPPEKFMRLHLLTPDKMPIHANRELVASVFRNLVDNALAHSSGRDIFVKMVKQDPSSYTFSVSDNGIGIPAEYRDKVFERFFRIDQGRSRQRGGTGLGLSIVRNAVAAHGGTVSATERRGGGTEITFTLLKN